MTTAPSLFDQLHDSPSTQDAILRRTFVEAWKLPEFSGATIGDAIDASLTQAAVNELYQQPQIVTPPKRSRIIASLSNLMVRQK